MDLIESKHLALPLQGMYRPSNAFIQRFIFFSMWQDLVLDQRVQTMSPEASSCIHNIFQSFH